MVLKIKVYQLLSVGLHLQLGTYDHYCFIITLCGTANIVYDWFSKNYQYVRSNYLYLEHLLVL